MRTRLSLFPPHAFAYKGGGSSAPAPVVQAPPPPPPPAPTPAPPPVVVQSTVAAPPVTQSAIEVTQSRIDARRQAKGRKGLKDTILAGAMASRETQNALGGTPAGKSTLLGGG
jgi:hypothetical protein